MERPLLPPTSRHTRWALALAVALLAPLPLASCRADTLRAPYPAPRAVPDPARGQHLARTLRALAVQDGDRARPVKILFYGQSITREPWTEVVVQRLRRRFPDAAVVVENKSVGGFTAELLARIARADVLAFNPDLIVLHDLFHEPEDFSALINTLMANSTAEIAVQTTHRRDEGLRQTRWDDASSDHYRRVAQANALQLIDVRSSWLRYLDENHLKPAALLRDPVGHLNDAGNALMAALIERELVLNPTAPVDSKGILELGAVTWDPSGAATVAFDGTRVEAVVPGGDGFGAVRVQVDGVAPSTLRDSWVHPRIGTALCGDWPWDCAAPIHVGHDAPLVDEEWTLTLDNVERDGASFTFALKGSLTGADGTGVSGSDFRSTSGRVTIASDDWWLARAYRQNPHRYPDRIKLSWRPLALNTDLVSAARAPQRVVLAAGLQNSSHILTLQQTGAGAPLPLSLTVYKPSR